MAPRARRRRARGCRPPSGTLKGEDAVKEHLTVSAQSARCDGSPMTVRGGGVPAKTTALMPLCRMGPPPRSLLPMRITASWFGPLARRIQGCGTNVRAQFRSSPRTSSSRLAQVCRRARSPQGPRPLLVGATRPSLTASVRAGSTRLWVGAKKRLARSNKETLREEKWIGPFGHPLDKNRPIQGFRTPA
jgi:hypothetical protein